MPIEALRFDINHSSIFFIFVIVEKVFRWNLWHLKNFILTDVRNMTYIKKNLLKQCWTRKNCFRYL